MVAVLAQDMSADDDDLSSDHTGQAHTTQAEDTAADLSKLQVTPDNSLCWMSHREMSISSHRPVTEHC